MCVVLGQAPGSTVGGVEGAHTQGEGLPTLCTLLGVLPSPHLLLMGGSAGH